MRYLEEDPVTGLADRVAAVRAALREVTLARNTGDGTVHTVSIDALTGQVVQLLADLDRRSYTCDACGHTGTDVTRTGHGDDALHLCDDAEECERHQDQATAAVRADATAAGLTVNTPELPTQPTP